MVAGLGVPIFRVFTVAVEESTSIQWVTSTSKLAVTGSIFRGCNCHFSVFPPPGGEPTLKAKNLLLLEEILPLNILIVVPIFPL